MIPFNEEVYFAIFADYNLEIWPMQPIAYLVGIILFGLARYPFPFSGRIVLAAIALCWIYMAQNYLAVFLSQLLWATWILQILFYLQALVLLVVAVLPSRPEIRMTANNEGWTAVAIAAFVMIFYPMIAAQTGGGHAWPATQLAGVAPLPQRCLDDRTDGACAAAASNFPCHCSGAGRADRQPPGHRPGDMGGPRARRSRGCGTLGARQKRQKHGPRLTGVRDRADYSRSWRIISDPFSAIMSVEALVLADGIVGMIEASTTRIPFKP